MHEVFDSLGEEATIKGRRESKGKIEGMRQRGDKERKEREEREHATHLTWGRGPFVNCLPDTLLLAHHSSIPLGRVVLSLVLQSWHKHANVGSQVSFHPCPSLFIRLLPRRPSSVSRNTGRTSEVWQDPWNGVPAPQVPSC